ncbi:IS1634 family transposase [Methanomicrobium antiquum]|uniref:IS1634 family transposase n=1 Tax=Methanomicrobium antiquum TaxID=487686 RepID=A0AAF0FQ35_9EURY|nr:IS1634 family transposase [Methanomicrobium antiquum]WFN35857.1 IS1634 family transposase [Methanomicrobium antiquum]WFN36407.1 IS1634 family transposase [Methanomicrobium antiquum]WFN36603.1 IS1634 family transposase [Methanomicrobium antiquum]WFN37055.1 IS1634 family transposase [Methanomicrobium antiquum]WFN37507.1 IS1634 family transposase [Methanomicrobium antiquum]
MQTKLRTYVVEPNDNISFPIGIILLVKTLYEILNFSEIFGKHKKKGISIDDLLIALISYKLTDNFSIKRSHGWINRLEVLQIFNLISFSERTIYRLLETIGANREEIISDIQDRIFDRYDFDLTDINMDWTSIVLHGNKAELGKYGYSRDHRPDKKQITIGLAELANPINIPIGMTVEPGNLNDQKHFKKTYLQVKDRLKEDSLVIFDKGANSIDNTQMIRSDNLQYITGKKLNKSDDKIIAKFEEYSPEIIDDEAGIRGIKIVKPNSINYFYFSKKLQKEQLESRARKVVKQIKEAKTIQECIEKNKKLPKKFRINNLLVDVDYSIQTKLVQISEDEAVKLLEDKLITGREGFFCLKSSKNLTLVEALNTYRKKDSIEKIFHSLKNEIEIKPLRVWTDNSIYGALIIGFIAQLFISLIRFEIPEMKHTSTKFIKKSLSNLTVTIDLWKRKTKKYIHSNFDSINTKILLYDWGIS